MYSTAGFIAKQTNRQFYNISYTFNIQVSSSSRGGGLGFGAQRLELARKFTQQQLRSQQRNIEEELKNS